MLRAFASILMTNYVRHAWRCQICCSKCCKQSSVSFTCCRCYRKLKPYHKFDTKIPIAEFNAFFRRGASTGQQQQGGGTVASFLPGIAHYTARLRSRNCRTSRGRRSSSASSASAASKPKANNAFTREVVLLSRPSASTVVKGKKKAELLREGQVISSFDFFRSWTEEDVYRQLSVAFQDKLRGKRYERITNNTVNTVHTIFNSLKTETNLLYT